VASDRRAGLKRLPSGQAYIGNWPSGRKPVLCDESVQQNLEEAAGWAKVAVEVASSHASSLGGSPLLLSDRILRCSSSFTGLLVSQKGYVKVGDRYWNSLRHNHLSTY